MRALTKLTAGPGLELVDRPEPVCGPRDVKIRVLRAGLCGTDLHLEQWDDWTEANVKPPLVIGHEFFGEVVQIGEDVEAIQTKAQALIQASMKLGEAMYKAQQGEAGDGEASSEQGGDDVVDAEFEEVDGDDRKAS